MSSSKITGWWELINKLLKLNLSQAFLKAFTSLQKLHCRTTIFEKRLTMAASALKHDDDFSKIKTAENLRLF